MPTKVRTRIVRSSSVNEPIDTSKLTLGMLIRRMPVSSIGALILGAVVAFGAFAAAGFSSGTAVKAAELSGRTSEVEVSRLRTKLAESEEFAKKLRADNAVMLERMQSLSPPVPNPVSRRPSPPNIIVAAGTHGDACTILAEGNEQYSSGRFDRAISIFRSVESTDREGRSQCTSAIYATIASSYGILADRSAAADELNTAMAYMRFASYYNRAFAYAVACAGGDCLPSQAHWKSPPI